jgi:MFS family permease
MPDNLQGATLTMNIVEESKVKTIQWKQLWSLAALYSSIIIGWIAYYNYQPQLLAKYKFLGYSFFLVFAQAIILVITPPIAGKLGDRYRFKNGHRLPIITAGISFAAMIFMAVSFTLIADPGDVFRWIFPFLIVFWLVGMSIFTSPALSTLELFAPVDKIPRVMAILTIVSNLIYALEPVIVDIIEFLGAPATFVAGGLIVFLSGYALRRNSKDLFNKDTDVQATITSEQPQEEIYSYGKLLVLGIMLGIVTTVLFDLLPSILRANLVWLYPNAPETKWLLVMMLVISAAFSLPMSDYVNKFGLEKSFWRSAILSLTCMIPIFLISSPVITIIFSFLFVIGFTMVSVSSLPLAIQHSSFTEKVFCVGIFFSGVAIPDGIVELIANF